MTVEIRKGKKTLASFQDKQPLQKYMDLKDIIMALARYGSTLTSPNK